MPRGRTGKLKVPVVVEQMEIASKAVEASREHSDTIRASFLWTGKALRFDGCDDYQFMRHRESKRDVEEEALRDVDPAYLTAAGKLCTDYTASDALNLKKKRGRKLTPVGFKTALVTTGRHAELVAQAKAARAQVAVSGVSGVDGLKGRARTQHVVYAQHNHHHNN